MRLDLADLCLFLHVIEGGSITAGAARAHLALASVSERLRAMEADVGVALLERLPRGVKPTPAGEALAHHARLLLGQRERMRAELEEFASGARGTLCLHATTAALTHFLPGRIAGWLAERPNLKLDLRERTSQEIVDAVAAGLIEAGVVSSMVEATGVVLQPLIPDRLVVLVPAFHHLAQAKSLALKDVLGEAFVGLVAGSALQDHLDAQARRLGRSFALRAQMKTFEGVFELVSAGVGLAIVPEPVVQGLRHRHAGLRSVALSDVWAQRKLCVCYRRLEELSVPMRELLRLLLQEASSNAPEASL